MNSSFLYIFSFFVVISHLTLSELNADNFKDNFSKVEGTLKEFCSDCHNPEKSKGSLDFSIFTSYESIYRNRRVWNNVIEQVMNGEMPPRKKKQPSEKAKKELVTWIEENTQNIDCAKVADPGHVVIHRLNRSEYDNTIRDLTGLDLKLANNFPVQGGGGEGFDNNSEVMFFPAIYMEKYLEAAQVLANHAKVTYSRGIEFIKEEKPPVNATQYKTEAEFDYKAFFSDWRLTKEKLDWKKEMSTYVQATMKMLQERPEINKLDDKLIQYAKGLNLNAAYLENFRSYFGNLEHVNPWAVWSMKDWIRKRKANQKLRDQEIEFIAKDFTEKNIYISKNTTPKSKTKEITLPLKGSKKFTVSFGDAGDGAEFDVGVIHNGYITLKDGKKVFLKDLKLLEHLGEGKITYEKREKDLPIKLHKDGLKVIHGLEFKVPAKLVFECPENAVNVKAVMGVSDLGQSKAMIQAHMSVEDSAFPLAWTPKSHLLCGPGNVLSIQNPHLMWIYNYVTKKIFKANDKSIEQILEPSELATLKELRLEKDLAYRYPESVVLKLIKDNHKEGANKKVNIDTWPEAARKKYLHQKERVDKLKVGLNDRVLNHLKAFTEKTFRRPLEKGEFEPLKQLYLKAMAHEDNFQKAARLVIQKLFISPDFLYRYEKDRAGSEAMPLSDVELANRLSYFIWSSMPDETLMKVAREGRLQDDIELTKQVKRMLKDPKASALSKEFSAQWLGLRQLMGERRPNADIFKNYTDEVRDLMLEEANQVFMAMVKENKSILSLLDSNETYLNESLANYYGMKNVKGNHYRKVNVKTSARGGLLGLGAIQVATSYPDRTSPILRGLWILETLLGNPTPPPPEDVEINEAAMADPSLTMKERFAVHRNNPTCAICHDRIDPIGFTMESFDAAGRVRSRDNGHAIDDLGELKHGVKIKGVPGLKDYILKEKKQEFLSHFTAKLLGFSLGRSLDYYDDCVVDNALEAIHLKNYQFQDLVVEVVKSLPFRFRRNLNRTTHVD